jgi:hypothetical protein
MKKLIGTLIVSLLAATASAETGRLFFDALGNGGTNEGAHPGGLALGNPVLNAGGGRLYIYWQFGRPNGAPGQNVLGLNYNVTVDGGALTGAMNFQNPAVGGFLPPRWQPVMGNPAPNPAVNPGGASQRFTAVNINAFGLKNDASAVALDTQYNAASNSTILGYVDVESQGGEVYLTVDTLGIAIQGGSPQDEIFMGFGDAGVPAGGAPGRRTSIADATIVPEPASMLLLGLGALALRRRR